MNVALLDVNVLVALFDTSNPSHDPAHEWFAREGWRGWATSTTTLSGCVRVLSNPAYPSNSGATPLTCLILPSSALN
jgi:predicted nucleic acid-binding protein